MEAVTMTDIAKRAGVSIATVGRVLHGNGYVSEGAREKVETAVKDLGYVPNAMARALKSQKSGVIGSLVVSNENNLYQKINHFLIDAAERRGYQMITLQSRKEVRDEEQILNRFIGMRIDGLAVISNTHMTDEMFDKLHAVSIPVVAVERTYDHPFVDNIVVRDQEGVYDAARRFLRAGHRNIALIAAEPFASVERLRLAGYQKAMEEAGIPEEDRMIRLLPAYSVVRGRIAMENLLSQAEPPTAVLCTADTLAAGAMQALYQAGKRVPEDVSISGYDNMLADQLSPPIDSVDLDLGSIGEVLFTLLKRRMDDPGCAARREYLDTTYVSRGTIADKKEAGKVIVHQI